MILRNFMYLDTNSLNDYLATIEGYVTEETEIKENEKSLVGGKAGIKVIEGNASSEKATETKRKVAYNDAAKFQKLYELLEDNNMIQFLDAFDEEIWNSIRRGEILEIPAKISIPKTFKLWSEMGNITPLIDMFSTLGVAEFQKPEDTVALNGIKAITALNENQDIPVILESESVSRYSFVSRLPKKYLRCELNDLQGDITIIGKVQRKIEKGKKEEIFSLVSSLDSILGKMSRDERRKFDKSKVDNNISDFVNGPSIILTPLALFR